MRRAIGALIPALALGLAGHVPSREELIPIDRNHRPIKRLGGKWRNGGSTKKRRVIDRAAIKAQRKVSVRTRRGW